MLCNRIKQFREYNKISVSALADFLGISTDTYLDYESGNKTPDIDIITKLAQCYKVTIDEFYGYTPRLVLHSKDNNLDALDVPDRVLKMSDLSWEEKQIILYYRTADHDENLIKQIIENNNKNE